MVRFGLSEVKIGHFPAQVLAVLQNLCKPRHIAELCLTDELDARTDWLLQRLTAKSPTALRSDKAMMRAAFDVSSERSISFLETQIMTLALIEDAKEGRASFVEKRAPNWTGR